MRSRRLGGPSALALGLKNHEIKTNKAKHRSGGRMSPTDTSLTISAADAKGSVARD